MYSPWPNIFQITNTTTAASVSSGALQVVGGAGIGKDLWIEGNIERTSGGYPSGSVHPLDIVGGSGESTIVGSFRSLNPENQSMLSFQNPAQTGDIINIGSSGTSFVIMTSNLVRVRVQEDGNTVLGKVLSLTVSTAAPSPASVGMFAVADRVTWDPASKGSGNAYPVFYNGSTWNALY
jgi:hypothetical protein